VLPWRIRRRTAGAEGLRDTAEDGQRHRSRPGDLQIGSLKHHSPNFVLKLAVEATILLGQSLYFLIFAIVSDAYV
jgi:hypothetical protein